MYNLNKSIAINPVQVSTISRVKRDVLGQYYFDVTMSNGGTYSSYSNFKRVITEQERKSLMKSVSNAVIVI